jgi:large subunit ribosomal protein L23
MVGVIKRPIITEKNTILNAAGVYVFEVNIKATKDQIKKAVSSQFGVKVKNVNTAICRGRAKANKFGKGRVPHWKKALVALQPGEKIGMFEGV